MNPFSNRTLSLSGPATDALPVTPDDAADLEQVAVGLYIEIGGNVSFVSARGEARVIFVADFSMLPVGVRRVHATGTTASGIHALVIA